ncbi:MAG: hypothetical protein R3Y43_00645 [Alphaproteobacteria bacterium]
MSQEEKIQKKKKIIASLLKVKTINLAKAEKIYESFEKTDFIFKRVLTGNNENIYAFDKKINGLFLNFKNYGIKYEDVVNAAIKQPQLFYQSPDTIKNNVWGVIEKFEEEKLSSKGYVKVAFEKPQLLCFSSETIERNIRGVAQKFEKNGLTTKKYLSFALKNPQLFHMLPDTIEKNILGVVDKFKDEGLSFDKYFNAVLKAPTLFYQSSDTVAGNINAVVEKFEKDGLENKDYLKAALKQPSLFYQNPKTVESNIKGVVNKFKLDGLTMESYLKAALRNPSLLSQSPDTIVEHIQIIKEMVADKVVSGKNDVFRVISGRSSVLSFSNDNLRLRHIYGHALKNNQKKIRKLSSLLSMPRPEVEDKLIDELGAKSNEVLRLRKMNMFKYRGKC